uniref:Uncharacterized protein n=1 Tax=Chenopodium quinoa TaxID=63459 RepID=A0A803MSE8_CHEQI
MKGNRHKVVVSQSQVPEYELQKLQKLKSNAERMKAQGSGSLANKILQEKTKSLLSPGTRQNDILEDGDEDSTSEYDGEIEGETTNIMEIDNLDSGKRKGKLCKQVSKLHNSSVSPRTMVVGEMNSQKKHHVNKVHDINSTGAAKKVHNQCIQKNQQEQQVVSKMKDKKRAFGPPGSMSAYLEFQKRQKENNEYDDALNESDDNDQLIENDYDDALIENDDGVGNEFEGDQELEWEVLPQFGREEIEKASKSKRHRGPTMLPRTREERPAIILNTFGQPVGPTKEIVREFKLFLGTVARDSELAPLNYINFTSLPTLQEIWDYVLETSRINKENRLMLDDMHTMGPNSFAILRHELKQQDPNKQEPSQAKVYKESRKRTTGRTYLTNNEKAEQNIAKMDALESSNHEDGSNSKDPYSEVIPNPKRKSRLRLYGKGVRMTDLKKKDKKSDFIFPEEFIATPNDASSAPRQFIDQNRQSSKSGGTVNQAITQPCITFSVCARG